MRVFLGIVARADNGSSAEERSRAGALALRRANALIRRSFPSREAPRATVWRSNDGAVVLAAWDNESEISAREPLRLIAGGALADAGYLTGTVSDVELAASPDLLDLSQHIGGCFAIGRATRDAITAVTDASSSVNLFTGESPRLRVVGSRALLAHLVLEADVTGIDDPEPVLNGLALRQMATEGHFFGGFTPFLGITSVPPATEVRLDRWFSRRRANPAEAPTTSLSREESARLAGDVAGRLIEAFEPFRDTPLSIRLSGGRDSRIIAAAAHNAGLQINATTAGVHAHADVVLSRRIAAELGINHTVIGPSQAAAGTRVLAENPIERITRALDVHDGMSSAWDDIVDYGPMTTSHGVSGVGGEVLRGGLILPDVDVLTPEIAMTRIRNTMSGSPLFGAAVTEAARAFAAPYLELAAVTPHRAIDDYYFDHTTARWVAARRSGARFRTLVIDPLLDNRFIRAVRNVPARYRWDERLTFDVISLLAPQLRHMQPERQRWRFERQGPVLDDPGLAETWGLRAALTSPPGVRQHDWKQLTHPNARESLRTVIRDNRDAMGSIISGTALDAFLAQDEYRYPTAVWHLATVAVMVGTPWHRSERRPQRLELELELDPNPTR